MNRAYKWFTLLALAAVPAGAADDFASAVYPTLQRLNCRACHFEDGIASATRLHFPDPAAPPAAVEAFGRGLSVLVDRANPGQSILLLKPTGRVKHTGGKLIAPGSPEDAALKNFVFELAKLPDAPPPAPVAVAKPAPVLMRRLTHSQYNNTVRDLLGDQTSPANQFPQEDFVNGFKNQAEAQSIPALLAEAYGAAAEKLARNAFRGGESVVVPCKPKSADDAGCREQFLRSFGLHAFRRPLTDREMTRYGSMFAAEAKRAGKFNAGAQLVIEAMLQSPNFLFRVERDGNDFEVASRLSYLLWDTMPDDKLFGLAGERKLHTREQVERAAQAMLDAGKARQALDEFTSQWLRFDRLLNQIKDRRAFPTYTPELAVAMTEETRRLVSDLVWNDRNFMSIYDAPYSFINGDLASLYKLPAPVDEFGKVQYPADSDRAGIIGQATFLALTSKPGDTSPTARGLFVREQFLCQHVPDPPPGTNSNLPPVSEDKPRTNRDRLAVHVTHDPCMGCHRLIDPIGFGLEKFDAIGGYRAKLHLTFYPAHGERNKKPSSADLDLDTRGEISGIANSEFSNPRELGKVLARTEQCQECIVKQYFRYAWGRPETAGDRALTAAALDRFKGSQFHFKELMIAIARDYAVRN